MRRLGTFTLVLFWTSFLLQSQDSSDGIVSGTVINGATGQPVARAQVVLRVSYANYGFRDRLSDRPMPADSARTLTDDSGKFTISFDADSPASLLFVSREGFRSEDNREIAALPMRPAGSRNVLVRLIPQSAIHGRAVGKDGEPLPGILIQAIREEIQDGTRRLRRNFAAASTGPDGEYTLKAVTPGVYRLQASGVGRNSEQGYGPVYFPDASEPGAAEAIRIGPGQTVTADFKLAARLTYRVMGVLNNVNPLRRVALRLMRGDEPLNYPVILTAGNRSFEINGVPPGSYLVQAYTPDFLPSDYGEAAISISDHDVAKVQVTLNPAVDVRGRIEFTGARHPERYAFVLAEPLNLYPPLRVAPAPKAMMAPDGTFLLRNLLPGQYQLSVRLAPDSYLESIMAGSTDVQQNGFTVGPGRPPELKITIHKGGGSIEGSLEGFGSSGVVPVLFVQNHGTARTTSLVNANGGRFLAFGLAPGDYMLYALPASEPIEYKNSEVLNRLSAFAVRVTVRDGTKEFVTLKCIPPQPF
jgi:hypothetical protein